MNMYERSCVLSKAELQCLVAHAYPDNSFAYIHCVHFDFPRGSVVATDKHTIAKLSDVVASNGPSIYTEGYSLPFWSSKLLLEKMRARDSVMVAVCNGKLECQIIGKAREGGMHMFPCVPDTFPPYEQILSLGQCKDDVQRTWRINPRYLGDVQLACKACEGPKRSDTVTDAVFSFGDEFDPIYVHVGGWVIAIMPCRL